MRQTITVRVVLVVEVVERKILSLRLPPQSNPTRGREKSGLFKNPELKKREIEDGSQDELQLNPDVQLTATSNTIPDLIIIIFGH